MSAPQECMSWADAPALVKVTILDILGPRVPILDSMPDVPKTHGYLYLIVFLPLWRRGAKRFAYIGKKSKAADMTYRGSGRRGEFHEALEECPPADTLKVFLGVFPRGRNLSRMEHLIQRKVGIPEAGEGDNIDHPIWLNRYAYGGDKWQHMTFEQRVGINKAIAERERVDSAYRARMYAIRSAGGRHTGKANGKIRGPVLGRIYGAKNGPAAVANMQRRSTILAASNDRGYSERLAAEVGLPLIPPPAGWGTQKNAARNGFDIADNAIIIPVAIAQPTATSRSGAKKNLWQETLYRRGASTFAQCAADRRQLYPGDQSYGTSNGARQALSRDSLGGWFSICCPETGRVVRGPGSDQETLRWVNGRWLRGRVCSLGPYSHLLLPGGPPTTG